MRMVLVDDQKELCQGLAKRIETMDSGHQVIGKAYNGLEGEKLIRLLKPDIALIDIHMPFQSGLQVLENIKKDPDLPCKVIMLTAYSEFQYVQQALRLGAFDYVLKPVAVQDLRKLFARCEGEKKEEHANEPTLRMLAPAVDNFEVDLFVRNYLEKRIEEFDIRQPLLLQSLEIVRKHYRKALTLQQVAKELHVSESYLSRLFTAEFHFGFIKLLHKLRIDLSLFLLKQSKLTISEIARITGFENVTYFGRIFKELTGCSASEYRLEKSELHDR